MKAKTFEMKCLTNMHVGSGNINFNITDNEVEKDPLTNLPMINSSGVKGSLREFSKINDFEKIKDIFGSEKDESQQDNSVSIPGKIKFLSANMLGIPFRSSDHLSPFYLVTTKSALEMYFNLRDSLSIGKRISLKNIDINTSYKAISLPSNIGIEGIEITKSNPNKELDVFLVKHLSGNYCILAEKDFKNLNLPVMARNKLDNGKSENLWYEEIVPHESVFYFNVISYDAKDDYLLGDLSKGINNKIIQFGGNASIGYGFTKVSEIGGD